MKINARFFAFERRGPPGQGPDFDRIFQSFRTSDMGGRMAKGVGGIWAIIAVIALVLWLASGVYTVDPSEQAIVRVFGAATSRTGIGPGLHWRPPSPIGQVDIVKVLERKRMEVGFRGSEPFPTEALMITGDTNIVQVEMLVQYEIKDIFSYLFNVWDPGERVRGIGNRPDGRTLKDAAEATIRQVVGSRPIDDVLTEKRAEAEGEAQELLQRILDSYGTGIRIVQVQLQRVGPPGPVQSAFNDVISAREDKERIINLAQAYSNDILPKARGEAQKAIKDAQAFREARIAEAVGQASRFTQVLREYQKAKDVTRQRLYLETMEDILPGIKKFIITPQPGSNVVQFLPLEGVGGSAGQVAGPAAVIGSGQGGQTSPPAREGGR